MASKRERMNARRRYEKRMVRAERSARRRQERTAVLIMSLVAVIAIVVAALTLSDGDDTPEVVTEPTPQSSDDLDPAVPESNPLPTTQPQLYENAPPPSDSLNQDWNVTMTTNVGDITMVVHGADAPAAVANFVFLAQQGFYDGTACHRLLPDSLLQCGDPTATGTGGPGYSWGPIENAPADELYPAGTIAMAREGGNGESMGSQFFLVFNDVQLPADNAGGYSVFGEVTGGLDILQSIGQGGTGVDGIRPAMDVIIMGVEVV